MRLAPVLAAIAITVAPLASNAETPPMSAPRAGVSALANRQPDAVPTSTVPTLGSSVTTSLDNPFLPAEENVSDCVSALPQPECGSKARGDWRQATVFAVMIVGLALIALRLVLAVIRRDRRTA